MQIGDEDPRPHCARLEPIGKELWKQQGRGAKYVRDRDSAAFQQLLRARSANGTNIQVLNSPIKIVLARTPVHAAAPHHIATSCVVKDRTNSEQPCGARDFVCKRVAPAAQAL